LITPLFRAADNGQLERVTSSVILLAVPCRANNDALAVRYEALLANSRGIRLIDVTRDQLRQALRLRASTNLRTSGALQIDAAQEAGCSV
jgi:hypothetical protein